MADELIFGVALKNTGDDSVPSVFRSARDDMEALKKSTEELAAASSKTAGGWDTDFAAMQKRLNEFAIAEDNARDKAWALANGYHDVGGTMVKASVEVAEGMDKTAFATNRAMQEMVVLGREIATGNFTRMPGTLSIIAQGLGPVGWAVAGVTALVAAGGYAWYEWGDTAHKALEQASDDLAAAEKAAKDSKHITQMEQLADYYKKISEAETAIAELTIKKNQADAGENRAAAWKDLDAIKAWQQAITNLKRDAVDLQATLEKASAADAKRANAPAEKILSDAKRFDDAALESHKDGLGKWADAWQQTEDLLTKLGAAGAARREAHEHTATVYMQAELDKRNAATVAADKKKADAEAAHMATQMAGENLYFAQVAAATAKSDNSAKAAEEKRFRDETAAWQKRYEQAQNDHALSLAEEEAFQNAIFSLTSAHNAAMTQLNKQQALADLQTLGEKSRVFFEITKLAAVADIVMSGGKRAEASAAWAAAWGGPIAAGIAEALSWAATAINVAKVESTQFGGSANVSSSGGVPSFSAPSTTPSIPVSMQSPPPPSAVAAQTVQQLNFTIIGAKDNPDKALVSYNGFVDIINGINKAGANGHRINATVIAA